MSFLRMRGVLSPPTTIRERNFSRAKLSTRMTLQKEKCETSLNFFKKLCFIYTKKKYFNRIILVACNFDMSKLIMKTSFIRSIVNVFVLSPPPTFFFFFFFFFLGGGGGREGCVGYGPF